MFEREADLIQPVDQPLLHRPVHLEVKRDLLIQMQDHPLPVQVHRGVWLIRGHIVGQQIAQRADPRIAWKEMIPTPSGGAVEAMSV